jgi:hypothetical protein
MIGLALGLPAMGKTQALQDYTSAHALQNRFLVIDRTDDWASSSPRWRGLKWKDWTPRHARLMRMANVSSLALTTDRPWFANAPPPGKASSWLEQLPATGVFRFGHPWEGADVAAAARDVGNAVYVDDEIDFTALTAGWSKNPLRDFAHRGRHLPNAKGVIGEVHVLGAARRAQSLHIDMTTLADFVWIFRLKGMRTLERLVDDSLLEEEDLPRIRELPPTEFKFWQGSGDSSWGKLTPY